MKKALAVIILLVLWMTCPKPGAVQENSPTPQAVTLTPGETTPVTDLTPVSPGFTAPLENAALNGIVTISGSAPAAWELAFAYPNDPTGTWFLLASSSDPFTGDLLAAWDTTLITDGPYTLRLRVFAADSIQDYFLNIRIRNNSPTETPTPIETPTPTITLTASLTRQPSATPTVTYTPALPPTPLPANPAALQTDEIGLHFGTGALTVAAIFSFFGLLLALSLKLRSR